MGALRAALRRDYALVSQTGQSTFGIVERSQAGWGLLHSRRPHAEWSLAALACAHGPRVAMRSADRAVHQLCTYWEEALNASGLQVGTWI